MLFRSRLEASLDVEVIRAVAPRATILVYEAPNTAVGELKTYDRILAGRARIVSDSWGACDSTRGLKPVDRENHAKYRAAVEGRLAKLAAVGISLFVATGDAGAYDCQRSSFADHHLTVDFPADSPSVVAVGGTELSVRNDGTYFREVGWQDPLTNGGGGGGVNPVDPKPPWQAEIGRRRVGKECRSRWSPYH